MRCPRAPASAAASTPAPAPDKRAPRRSAADAPESPPTSAPPSASPPQESALPAAPSSVPEFSRQASPAAASQSVAVCCCRSLLSSSAAELLLCRPPPPFQLLKQTPDHPPQPPRRQLRPPRRRPAQRLIHRHDPPHLQHGKLRVLIPRPGQNLELRLDHLRTVQLLDRDASSFPYSATIWPSLKPVSQIARRETTCTSPSSVPCPTVISKIGTAARPQQHRAAHLADHAGHRRPPSAPQSAADSTGPRTGTAGDTAGPPPSPRRVAQLFRDALPHPLHILHRRRQLKHSAMLPSPPGLLPGRTTASPPPSPVAIHTLPNALTQSWD